MLLDSWIADVVGRMRIAGITNRQLAEETGFAYTYISTVLHGVKGDANTKTKIMDALARLEKKVVDAEANETGVKEG